MNVYVFFILGALAGGAAMNVINCIRSIKERKSFEKEATDAINDVAKVYREKFVKASAEDLRIIQKKNEEINRLYSENLRLSRALAQLETIDFAEVGTEFAEIDVQFGGGSNE